MPLRSANSVRTYAAFLRSFFTDPDRDPADYEKNDVLKWLSSPSHSRRSKGQPVAAATSNYRKSCLQSFLLFCSQWTVTNEQGIKHLKRCYKLLEAAERKIELLTGVADDGTPATEPFDESGESLANSAGRRKRGKQTAPPASNETTKDDVGA